MKRKRKRNRWIIAEIGLLVIAVCVSAVIFTIDSGLLPEPKEAPPGADEQLKHYNVLLNEGRYEDMYEMLTENFKSVTAKEDFITKNKNIYEGIEAKDISLNITAVTETEEQTVVSYDSSIDTAAGKISFSNEAAFIKTEEGEYRLSWTTRLIFPSFNQSDKIRVNTLKSNRGDIVDRNGEKLAGEGTASSVGFVPGKMSEDREADIIRAAEILNISAESITKKLSASYVKDDMFIPVKTIPNGLEEVEAALLEIQGVKISSIPVRYYPLAEAASHLTGYIQNVTAEDLDRLDGQGYNSNSAIGRTGLEKTFEERLRGIDGCQIVIVNAEGEVKQTLAEKRQKDGETVRLTVDAWLQKSLYDSFSEDKSTAVAMNPKTGEVLALVSTPSFDSNDFVIGLSETAWTELNENEDKPLYNRFKAALCPGSGFKPIIAAIGLTIGSLEADRDYGRSGRSWQKDGSWGGYKITTLKEYDNAVLENALIYSDNIYFAKAALEIGGGMLAKQLLRLGFDESIPLEEGLYWSSFSADNSFDNEILLADSGYGQGQVLVNPVHMASLYSAFVNGGNMIRPYLLRDGEKEASYWKENVFTEEAARIVRDAMIQVVEQGAGGLAKVDGQLLVGKTGTAEIKQAQDDTEGTELGWFNVFSADENAENPLLIISMVEDVKERGGSGYVTPKIRKIFESR